MSPRFDRFEEHNIFEDKGEVKHLVENLIQDKDPDVTIHRIRKMDHSYLFTLSKKEKIIEVELLRGEIEDSMEWRKGKIDNTLKKKIEISLLEFLSEMAGD